VETNLTLTNIPSYVSVITIKYGVYFLNSKVIFGRFWYFSRENGETI